MDDRVDHYRDVRGSVMTSRNTFLHSELICLPQVGSQSQKMFKHRISLGVVCLLSIVYLDIIGVKSQVMLMLTNISS